jgi:DnaJ-class molecular chaperone
VSVAEALNRPGRRAENDTKNNGGSCEVGMVAVDPYELLGVQRTSSTADVVSAYEHLGGEVQPVPDAPA